MRHQVGNISSNGSTKVICDFFFLRWKKKENPLRSLANPVSKPGSRRLQTSCLISLNLVCLFNNGNQSIYMWWELSDVFIKHIIITQCLQLSMCSLTIILSLKIISDDAWLPLKFLEENTNPTLAASSILQTFGCQPQLLLVKPAILYHKMVCHCLCIEGKHKCQAPVHGSPCVHKHAVWFEAVPLFKGSLSYYPDHTASDCFTTAHWAVVSVLLASTQQSWLVQDKACLSGL